MKAVFKTQKNIDMVKGQPTWHVYQMAGHILSGVAVKDAIETKELGWWDPTYTEVAEKIAEFDSYLRKPFDIVAGVVKCPKCKSDKTFNVQRQTRGSDEPMTTFSTCSECLHKWTYSG